MPCHAGREKALADTRSQRLAQFERAGSIYQGGGGGGPRFHGLKAAAEWVAAHRAEFKGPVYGPAALEIDVLQVAERAWLARAGGLSRAVG
jgi:hypothetical protein